MTSINVSARLLRPRPSLNARSYKSVAAILKNGTDKTAPPTQEVPVLFRQHPRPWLPQLIRRSSCSFIRPSNACAHSASLSWPCPHRTAEQRRIGGSNATKGTGDTRQTDFLRSRLDATIDMRPLIKLARTIDWSFLER
ncbi:hypothetical protein ACVWXM_009980 [Bradyrhizobium sp. GM7.3]